MSSNYNNAAWFYDRLSRLVYGKTIIKAQTQFLHFIPPGSKILIVGGGTGWLLQAIARHQSAGLAITYVEISKKMMSRSKKRNSGNNTVNYITAPIEEANLQTAFDVVITPFLLDSLSPVSFNKVFIELNKLLATTGIWINTDFQLTGKWWQLLLLKSMYLFFRMIGCIDNVELPAIKQRFTDSGYKTVAEETFFGEFIVSTVYTKQ